MLLALEDRVRQLIQNFTSTDRAGMVTLDIVGL